MKNGPYILVVPPEDYPGKKYRGRYAYEHHVVYWKKFGLVPKIGELIHHKNHEKTDNSIRNLELINVKEHCKHHARPIAFVNLLCFKCKKDFKRQKRIFDFRKKRKQSRFFCSRSCQISTAMTERWAKLRGA